MKKVTNIICLACMLVVSCTSKKVLSKEDAFQKIQQGKQFPKVIEYDLYCGDPQQAKKVIDAGLETDGLLKVQRTQKLGEAGSPLIHLTDKAQVYLLPTPEKDKSSNIQKVKLGEEQLVEVTGITTSESGKDAVVEYTTAYKDLTPFSVLVATNYKQISSRKASFSFDDEGWKLEK